ncbi:MAG: hypothetical protein S0880_04645 [Actinomycetota bacterium]|nr:hypothetical protein [Actinomycetota bacterium]
MPPGPVVRGVWCALVAFVALLVPGTGELAGTPYASARDLAGTDDAPGAARSLAPPAQIADDRPAVELVEQTPWVTSDGTFALRVRTNDIDVAELTLTVHRPVVGRIGFTQSLDGTVGRALWTITQDVAPDTSAVFRVPTRDPSSPFDSERLRTGAGVLPVVVTATDADGTETGRLVTHLVRLPAGDDRSPPLSVALVAPVHHAPLGRPDRTIDASEQLITELEELVAILDAHQTTPMTLVPTPELVASLVDLGRADLANTLRGDGLAALTNAGPFVDVEPARWLASELGEELDHLRALGTEALRARPSTLDTSTLIATGPLDDATLRWWSERGSRLVVPEEDLVPLDRADFPFTLTSTFRLDAAPDLRVAAIDPGLAAHLDADDPRLGAHHLIADLAVLWGDRPADVRGVVVTSEDGSAIDPVLLQELLDALAEPAPIFVPTTVAGLFGRIGDADDPSAAPSEGPDASTDQRPAAAAALVREVADDEAVGELGSFAFELRRASDLAASYRTLVGDDAPAADAVDGLVVRSGARQLDEDERDSYLEAATVIVENDLTGVDLPGEQALTLTDRTGTVPVVVRTDQPDGRRVTLRLDATDITFPEGDRIDLTLDEARQELEVPVRLERQGDLRLGMSVVSPDGQLLLAESELTVRSRQLSGVGIVLSIGAGLFLLLWWGRHLVAARRAASTAPDGSPGTDAADDTAEPDTAAPDTAAPNDEDDTDPADDADRAEATNDDAAGGEVGAAGDVPGDGADTRAPASTDRPPGR